MNRFFTLLLAASCLVAVGQVPDYVPTEGLVGWYSLDGDVSQFSFNTSQGGSSGINPTQNRFSQPQTAVAIGGGDFCLFNDVESLDAIGEWTFSIWIRPSLGIQSINYPHIWRFYDPDSYASIVMHLMGPAYANEIEGQIELYMTDSEGVQNPDAPHLWEATPSLDVWSHVVARRENGEISVFLNSVLTASYESSDYGLDSLILTGLTLGGNADYPVANRIWLGGLDDAGVWRRALSEAEIFSLYNAPGPLEGCSDESACNFVLDAVIDDGSCLYVDNCGECGGSSIAGCIDDQACNFNAEAACDDGSCDYTCCPGPGCCDLGLTWNWELSLCQDLNPADINLDGCVQLNDLLDLLSAYGNCTAEESAWQCGDPLEYQGYDYGTVQIGEQCWFAENLRAEYYRNGDSISHIPDAMEWVESEQGAWVWYSNGSEGESYGRLYNSYVVTDARQVCPSGWRVFSTEDWNTMTSLLDDFGNVSSQLKSSLFWPEGAQGSNSSGFAGLPGGYRSVDGSFELLGETARWWTTNTSGAFQVSRGLTLTGTYGSTHYLHIGFSIRCIKDAE